MSKRESEEFLEEVDEVNQAIQRIVSGEMGEKEYEELERRVNRKKYEEMEREKNKRKEEEKQEKLRQMKLLGKEGKGEGENYLLYCPKCCLEYEVEVQQCARCRNSLLTKEQRKRDLV